MENVILRGVWGRVVGCALTGIIYIGSLFVPAIQAQDQQLIFWASDETQTIQKIDLESETRSSQIMKMGLGQNAKHIFVDTVRSRLYWIGGTDIRSMRLDGSDPAIEFRNVARGNIGGLTMDMNTQMMYWSESDSGHVRRLDIQSGDVSTIIDASYGLQFPMDLTIYRDSLFILDRGLKKVALDGSGLQMLDDEYTRTFSLSLDPVNKKIYWTTRDDGGLILRANLDGSGRESVASSQNPQGITVDAKAGLIYWISLGFNRTLLQADLDGENDVTLYETQNDMADTHVDAAGNLYWSKDNTVFSIGPGMIWRRAVDGTITTVVKELGLAELVIDSEDNYVFWFNHSDGSLLRSDFDFQQTDTVVASGSFYNISKLAIDTEANQLFYGSAGTIYSNNYDGTAPDSLAAHVGAVSGIAVNPSQSTVYWTDNGSTTLGNLKMVNYATGQTETLISQSLSYARSLKIDPSSGRLYWGTGASFSDWSTGSSFSGNIGINTAASDGTGVNLLFGLTGSVEMVHSIALDTDKGRIVFTDSEGGAIYSVDASTGGDLQTVYSGIDTPLGLDVMGGTSTDLDPTADVVVTAFQLEANYPNPFNPATTIQYSLVRSGNVRLAVYDMLGREVAVLVDERQASGQHQAYFDAGGLASGSYLYRLETDGASQMRKMLLVK